MAQRRGLGRWAQELAAENDEHTHKLLSKSEPPRAASRGGARGSGAGRTGLADSSH